MCKRRKKNAGCLGSIEVRRIFIFRGHMQVCASISASFFFFFLKLTILLVEPPQFNLVGLMLRLLLQTARPAAHGKTETREGVRPRKRNTKMEKNTIDKRQ